MAPSVYAADQGVHTAENGSDAGDQCVVYHSAGSYTDYFYCLFTDNKEEKINDIAFRNILNSRQMLLKQPDYKKQRKNTFRGRKR